MAIPRTVTEAAAVADAAIEQTEDARTTVEDGPDILERLDQTPAADDTPDPDSVEDLAESDTNPNYFLEDPNDLNDLGDAGAPTPEVTEDDDGANYQQMYETLQGKYDAEVPQLHSALHQMQGQIDALGSVETQPAPALSLGEALTKDGFRRYLKDSEVEEYGEEILGIQSRMAQGVAEDIVSAALASVHERLATLESDGLQSSADMFWERVERVYSGARRINDSDPLWHEFLKRKDRLSGLTYLEIGDNSVRTKDVGRLVDLLQKYRPIKLKTDPKGRRGSPKPKPSGTHVVTARGTSDKGFIKESSVQKFWKDVALKKYEGREDEIARREKEIESAYLEERVLPG